MSTPTTALNPLPTGGPGAAPPPADGRGLAAPASETAPATAGVGPEAIAALRRRIDSLDHELIGLWTERAALSRQIGAARIAAGGTRLALAREQEVISTFRDALGPDGAQLAVLLLRAGRGRL